MAAGERPEGRQKQLLLPPPVGEAGQPQPVGAAAHHRHRMQVAAEIQQAGPGFWSVAQPQRSEGTGGFANQALQPAAAFVVALDQPQPAAQQLRQGTDLGAKRGGEAGAAVQQVAEHQHLLRPQAMGQRQQRVQGGGIAIAGQGDALGLKAFRLAQVQIRQQQRALGRIPHGPLGQQLQPVASPEKRLRTLQPGHPGDGRTGAVACHAQAAPIAFW